MFSNFLQMILGQLKNIYEDITKSYVYLHSQDVSPRGFSRDH